MRAIALLSIVALSGCATANTVPRRPIPDETVRIVGPGRTIEVTTSPAVAARVETVWYPLYQVWRVLPAVYDSLAIPVSSLDSVSHVIGNSGIKLRRRLGNVPLTRYLDCGDSQGAPSAETYEIHLSIFTRVQSAASGTTTVATTIEATGRPVTLSGEYVRCSSTGALESHLVNTLKAQLQG